MPKWKVLVLNASSEPIHVCTWQRAASLVATGKADIVERNGVMLAKGFPLPLVIRLRRWVHIPHQVLVPTRRNILLRDRYTCQYCGARNCELTIDHVLPRSRNGAFTWENQVTACRRCNIYKADRTPAEADMQLLSAPLRPRDRMAFELSRFSSSDGMYECWSRYMK